jgi:hypothetical protein
MPELTPESDSTGGESKKKNTLLKKIISIYRKNRKTFIVRNIILKHL